MSAKVLPSPSELTGDRRLLVFGGTFDPPHRAHVALPRYVREQLGADRIVYVPAARSPHKRSLAPTPAPHRLAMLEAALADADDAAILTLELDRAAAGEPSYTVDTLEQMRAALDERTSLYLLIGADQAPVFDKWHRAGRIEQLAEPVVMVRPPETRASLLDSLPPGDGDRWAGRIIETPAMDISATQVRERAAKGEPIADLVPPAVADYIHRRRLYWPTTNDAIG